MNTDEAEREFVEFVQGNLTNLYAVAFRVCGNRHLAEDLLQESLAKMWKGWPSKRNQEGAPLKGWAYRIIQNAATDLHRKKTSRLTGKNKTPVSEIPWDDERGGQIPGSSETSEEAIFRDTARDLWAAVATLDPVQQTLIHLLYVEQLSLNAACRVAGLKWTTASRYHVDALALLREIIGDDE
ncbi:RNA polymerase sigma factor [Streptomyces geranii]|uniref:RNA polymerase sigma factor n=1 Tax=Streptomyces geranii TaxID=2058923 RepID=UPI000D02AA73|nr:RNA polymerase sigma factor [Streptomyces geranii]